MTLKIYPCLAVLGLYFDVTSGYDAYFFSELCWGKAMVAYTMPQQRKEYACAMKAYACN